MIFSAKKPTKDNIESHLKGCHDPITGQLINIGQRLSGLVIDGKNVLVTLDVDPSDGTAIESLRQNVENHLKTLKNVKSVQVVLTAEREENTNTGKTQSATANPHGAKNPPLSLPNIKRIIAISSGKGGVGKSTVAANLAGFLASQGQSVGLLDADVYGPSAPRLFGLKAGDKPKSEKNRLEPKIAHGVKVMSMGFMIEENAPMVWRGPMVQTAIYQMLRDVEWGELDYLVVDMPPGTGDAQLTLAQKVPLSGAIIVSTPQALALGDAVKGIEMFRKVDVPVVGIIENMASYHCPKCGEESDIFGDNKALKAISDEYQVPYLGGLPLVAEWRQMSDQGELIATSSKTLSPDLKIISDNFETIASNLKEQLTDING